MMKSKPGNKQFDWFDVGLYIRTKYPEESKNLIFPIVLRKGEYIYQPGDTMNYIYQIVSGAVKIGSYLAEGEVVSYDALAKSDLFGNLKYLDGEFYEFSKALLDSEINCFDLLFFKKLIVHDPQMSDWFNYYIIKRWCFSELKLIAMNVRNSNEKILFLKRFFHTQVKDIYGQKYLLLDLLTKKDLADLVGLTRQTISKTMKEIQI